jgi:hypothetical protein
MAYFADVPEVADRRANPLERRVLAQPDEGAKCQHVLEGVHGPRSRRDLRCEQGPVRGLRQWRSWLTAAPESAAVIFVAYATFLPFSAYTYHALCVITCAVLHRTRRFPRE